MNNIFKSGDVFIWLTGLGLGISIVMISGLLLLITINSMDYLWPKNLLKVELKDGTTYIGQEIKREFIPQVALPDSLKGEEIERFQVKIGNRDIYGFDFTWIDSRNVEKVDFNPENAVCIERYEFGNFYGYIVNIKKNDQVVYDDYESIQNVLSDLLSNASSLRSQISKIEQGSIGSINYKIEQQRLKIQKVEYEHKGTQAELAQKIAEINEYIDSFGAEYSIHRAKVDSLSTLSKEYELTLQTAGGDVTTLPLIHVYRVYEPNQKSFFGKFGFLLSKIWEFIFDDPRESNTEGGIFPAIFGTIMMVVLMSIAVVPFGVLTALYLREYAKQGPLVRTVRIAVNNLAGVPSIVFGIFGLGFFIYFVGGSIDKIFYPERLPTPTWGTGGILWASLTLALLTVPVVIVATEEALATIPRGIREASLALGATKWQTISRIVLPSAAPGILTGLILAMARAAGEVAPLMITGVVKLAPTLPLDWHYPFFHLDRKFMHLGFHIYDVGFQSPNIEAALPMVYMTTLLLIAIVILLNLTAMSIRSKLRKKYKSSAF